MRNDVKAELIPSPAALVRARSGIDKQELDRLIDERVAKIMADRDSLVFEPWFRTRQLSYEVKRLQSVTEQRKFSIYYERYGCMDCKLSRLPHGGNGLCTNCRSKVFGRLAQISAEGVNDAPALPALGTPKTEASVSTNQPAGVHRTWKRLSSGRERLIYRRVAERLNVSPAWVRRVAHGSKPSRVITAALLEENAQLAREEKGDTP